jgi:DNA repair exonuclease SbcCD ATPase subunit
MDGNPLEERIAELEAQMLANQQQHATQILQITAARRALETQLHAKDAEAQTLAVQVERLEAALSAVERLMRSSARAQRLDRASLDAVSVHQLQAAVAQFVQGSPTNNASAR